MRGSPGPVSLVRAWRSALVSLTPGWAPVDPRCFPPACPGPGSPCPGEAPLGCEFAPRGRPRGQARRTVAVLRRTLTSDVRLDRSWCSLLKTGCSPLKTGCSLLRTGCSPLKTVSCPPSVRHSLWSDGPGHGPGACWAVPPRTAASHGHVRSLLFPGNPDLLFPGNPDRG